MPKHGEMKILHIPQIPMTAFDVPVQTLIEAKLLLDVLAEYDLFQFRQRVKPDYSNASFLVVFDTTYTQDGENPEGSWVDWYDEEGNDIDQYELNDLRQLASEGKTPQWEEGA
jgi:hypothetical protein